MRCIIAGSRTITDYRVVVAAFLFSGFASEVTEIVSGHAARTLVNDKWVDNVDRLGERLSVEFHLPLTRMPADWTKYGRAAGPIRNTQMAEYARGGALVAVWDGTSSGTLNMINAARDFGLRVHIHEVKV